MKKKTYMYITLLITLVLLAPLSLFLYSYKKQKESFSSLCIPEDKFNEIIKYKSLSLTPLLKELSFDGNNLFFDEQDNRFYYSLVEGSNTAYNPTVEWNGLLYNIAIKDNKITDDLIHYNQDIDILIYNNNQYTISKLTCTTLPLMNINVNVAMEDIGDTYQDMKMSFLDNKNNAISNLYGEIETRGSHSLRYPKKSFKIKLKEEHDKVRENISILDFPEGREYILYPGYNDQERIRNVFSTNLWYESCAKNNMFGIDNGQYYKYFELFLNGKYWGLYAITYPVDEKVYNLDLNEDSNNFLKENFYKKIDGYSNEFETDWDKTPVNGYDLKTNIEYLEAWEPLKNFYKTLLNSNNINEIYDSIDINNSIDIFLFYNLIQGADNVSIMGVDSDLLHNTFLFTKVDDGKIKTLYTPWDMDRTWGKGSDSNYYQFDEFHNFVMYINPIFKLIELNDKNVKRIIKERYEYLRSHEWSENSLINMINNFERDIYYSGAYNRDINRWPNSAKYNGELTYFKEYVINRLSYMDKYISEFVK